VTHGKCQNPERRAAAIANPRHFLKVYMAGRFYNPWAMHHLEMIAAIEYAAKHGGDQAIAAPRGDGKTEICTAMIVWAILACHVRFPVVVASTGDFALKIFKDVKMHFENNDVLAADFPEVCDYVKDLDGAPARANKQHNGGVKTRIVWTQHEVILPTVEGSPYGGVTIAYKGLDSAIRGIRSRGQRPDFILIDDPETKESAKSDAQIIDRTLAIDRDIAGLAGPDKQLSRVMLTTIQNRRCLSYKFTDPAQKPSWRGKRFKALLQEPEKLDMWEEYMNMRQQDQREDTRTATQYYADNREAMDAGAVMSNPHRIKPGALSALQSYYDQVADNGIGFALSELQNDPEEDRAAIETEITPGIVQRATSRLTRGEYPDGSRVFVGIDIGKYSSYWVKLALHGNATGHVIDYGVAQTMGGISETSDLEAIETAVLRMLLEWRGEIMADSPPELCMIDTGFATNGVYEFIRQVGGTPFLAGKGHNGGMRFDAADKPGSIVYDHCRADLQRTDVGLWLYNFDAVYWKKEVHNRFSVGPYDAEGNWKDGGLSVWGSESRMEHKSYSHHICAEVWEERFVEGKGVIGKWVVKSRKNHWLDATAMALCAAGVAGFKVLPRTIAQAPSATPQPQQQSNRWTTRDGRPWLVSERK
jgi:hypothetical protein